MLLRFHWKTKAIQFTCLPFGLSTAPRVFTKVLRPVIGWLRLKGVRCVIYFDDLLIMAECKQEATKSQVQPVQEVTILGLIIDSNKEELSLPFQKLSQIKDQARELLKQSLVSARELAQFIGKLSVTVMAVHPAPIHYRSLQHLKHQALLGSKCYDCLIQISYEAREDLEWWLHNVSTWNGRSLQAVSPELEVETDVSQTGWGAYCQGCLTGCRWSEEEKSLHINELELLAALFALKAFLKHMQNVSVLLKSNNMTTVAYIAKPSGRNQVSHTR